MEIFSGLLIILTNSFFLALTYGVNVMKGSKSVLPSILNGNKLVRVVCWIMFAVGVVRLLGGILELFN
jgi:hypothetical protein